MDAILIKKKIQNKNFILEIVIMMACSALAVLLDNSFKFNPYLIVILYASFNIGVNATLGVVTSSLITSFIIDPKYGIEVLLVSLIIIFSRMIFLWNDKVRIRTVFGLVTSVSAISIIYLINDFSKAAIINCVLNSAACFMLGYSFIELIEAYKNINKKIDDLTIVLFFSGVSLLGYGVNVLFYVLFTLTILILLKICRGLLSFGAILASGILMYFLLLISEEEIVLLILPFLFSVLFAREYRAYTSLIFFILEQVLFVPYFYLNGSFYQTILGFLFFFVFPNSLYDGMSDFFNRNSDISLINLTKKSVTAINNLNKIEDYIDILLDNSIESTYVGTKPYVYLTSDLCVKCPNFKNCEIIKKFKNINSFENNYKNEILENCIYPYKFLKRIENTKKILLSEQSSYYENESRKKMFKKQILCIKNIILDSKKQNNDIELGIEEIKEKIPNLRVQHQYSGIYTFNHAPINEHEYIKRMMEDSCQNISHIFYQDENKLQLDFKPKYMVDTFYKSEPFTKGINGDAIYTKNESNYFFGLLCDGMGHNKKSKIVANYLVNSLEVINRIVLNPTEQISLLNSLIKSKSFHENYGTLDYVKINLQNGEMQLLKAGSFPSYIYSEKGLIKVDKTFPPIGIIDEIDPFVMKQTLKAGDIIVLLSDGFFNLDDKKIEEIINKSVSEDLTKFGNSFFNELCKESSIEDDKTILILQIKEIKNMLN